MSNVIVYIFEGGLHKRGKRSQMVFIKGYVALRSNIDHTLSMRSCVPLRFC